MTPDTSLPDLLSALTKIAEQDARLAEQRGELLRQLGNCAVRIIESRLADCEDFVPSPLQARILDLLKNKARRTDDLAVAAGIERTRLFRPGGIKELRARGLISHAKAIGYYREDALPPGFSLGAHSSHQVATN